MSFELELRQFMREHNLLGWSSPRFAQDEFREDQVKRDHGKFAKQAGSGAAQPEAKKTEQPESSSGKTNGKGTHPGHGYSAEARVVNGKIQTSNVNDAVRALWEGRKVALEQPHQVSTLVAKLGGIAKRAEQLGGKAPNFDLCNVSVEGTNLFCAETKGIPRVQMPQLPDEKGPAFQKFLADKGFKATEGEEKVSFLKATQSELVGAKVSGIMGFFRGRDPSQDPPLFISRDNYIVDGHHRWAARVGLDAEKNMLGNVKVKVVRVDLPIIELLEQAETFTEGKGHKAATAHDKRPRWTIPTFLAGDAAFKKKDLAFDAALQQFLFRRLALALDKTEFKEANVKRDEGGKFAEQASSGAAEAAEATKAEEPAEPGKTAKGAATGTAAGGKAPRPKKPPKYKLPFGAETFMSPNVGYLTFEGAQSETATKRHRDFAQVSDALDIRLGIAPHAAEKHTEVIGAWTDGAENSLMVEYPRGADQALLRAAAAMKGHLANQKSVLFFRPSQDGGDHMATFEAKGSLEEIHDTLLANGLENHTLEKTEGGAKVHVYVKDGDQATADAVVKSAGNRLANIKLTTGHGEFIGNNDESGTDEEQRDRARKAYEKVIDEVAGGSGGSDVRKVWEDVGRHWRSATEAKQEPLEGSKSDDPATISTRRPWGVGSLESDQYRRVDVESLREEKKKFEATTDLLKNPNAYLIFRPGELENKSADEIAELAIDRAMSNLEFLYHHADEEVKKRGPQWYEGAHDMAAADAKTHSKPVPSVAGVYAALSPQKDWDQNVYLARALIDIHENKKDVAWDDEMTERALVGEGHDHPLYYFKNPEKPTKDERAILAAVDKIKGKQLGELTEPLEKAVWIRTYDEAHSDRHYDALAPDGTSLGRAKNDDGSEAIAGWQSMPSIMNAIASLESDGDRNIISEAMGEKHKVRSFYNNILDPKSPNGDVTMDTHAVGAALMQPHSGKSQAVMHSLQTGPQGEAALAKAHSELWKGAPQSASSGISGTYPIWADAYRKLAEKLKIQPRVLQSVTWESKRRLLPDTMTEATKSSISTAWTKYHLGDASLKETQEAVFKIATEANEAAAKRKKEAASGKPKKRPPSKVHGEDGYPANPRGVDHARLGQRPAGAMDSGARIGPAGRAAGHEPGGNRGQRHALMWSSPSYRKPLWTVPSYYRPSAMLLAMDRSTLRRSEISCTIAMDRTTARSLSEDGHLHVINNRISKATVNPYWGKEIPNFEQLGLDPEKKYMLLRHPKELARAAATFNNKPILAEHIPVSSAEHPHELVIGSTGTDARYEHPYLKSSLVFWPQAAIDAIQSEGQKELSCAYHYDPDMTPGVYEGQRFDGIMRNIRGNHVALVKDGRAGSDVVVQDAMPRGMRQWTSLPF